MQADAAAAGPAVQAKAKAKPVEEVEEDDMEFVNRLVSYNVRQPVPAHRSASFCASVRACTLLAALPASRPLACAPFAALDASAVRLLMALLEVPSCSVTVHPLAISFGR